MGEFQLHILIDSSTKPGKYGKSTAFWWAFKDKIEGEPFRVGVIYNQIEGTNRIFYDGIIRALEACFYISEVNRNIKIWGDNKLVIGQLKDEINVDKLEPLYNQVKKLESKYLEKKNVTISYEYLNEQDEIYKKVDRCAKDFLNFLTQRIR
ncbi:MAG: hypothetical protein ACTSQG_11495 [Promethearchaeota archaeon]